MQLIYLPLQLKALTLAGGSKYGMGVQGQDFSILAPIYTLERIENVYQDLADGMEGETSGGEVGVPI